MTGFSGTVFRRYFETTSSRSHRASALEYGRAADGLRRRFGRWLPPDRGAVCLDLGCGTGHMLYLLEREGFRRVTGVELDPEQLEAARRFVHGELVAGDALEYLGRCPAASVDFVSAVNVLEHMPKDTLLTMLREIRRVLRPGGSLIAMVPNALSPFGGLTRHWDITHEWAFTPNNFRQLAPLAGFDPAAVECRECGPVPHGLLSLARYALWQGIRAGIAAWFLIELGGVRDRVFTMDMLVRLRPAAA
jgi:SAM-dependent methyltransferase